MSDLAQVVCDLEQIVNEAMGEIERLRASMREERRSLDLAVRRILVLENRIKDLESKHG